MAKGIVVELTDEDIQYAVRQNSAKCMIARALKRAHPAADKVMVDIQTIRFTDANTGERLTWLTPAEAQRQIVHFDAGELSELGSITFRLLRRYAFRIQRQTVATPEDRAHYAAARAEGRSTAGTRRKVDVPVAPVSDGEPGIIRHSRRPPRASGTTKRIYGMRTLHVNQARLRNGDLPAEPEVVPAA